MRELATIREIKKLSPIVGADLIEVAQVDGWEVVTKKGEFSEGDLALYFEIDSWVPTELASFLSKGKFPREFNGVKGERLRTVKLRGQLSQGLLLPVSILESKGIEYTLGTDLTEILNVQKYEAPVPQQLAGQINGNFPNFIVKTDQPRAQNLFKGIFIDNIDSQYEVTMKLDGSSWTGFKKDDKIGVCSRNWELKIDDELNANNSFVRILLDSKMKTVLEKYNRNIAIQGELLGPGIQGNKENLKSFMLAVFDIYDIDNSCYFNPVQRHEILTDLWNIGLSRSLVMHVPVLTMATTLGELNINDIKGLLDFAKGPSYNSDIREGLVFKRVDGKFSFKSINNDWLLKNE
jgi:RNA ligase (TIGR02306 family)